MLRHCPDITCTASASGILSFSMATDAVTSRDESSRAPMRLPRLCLGTVKIPSSLMTFRERRTTHANNERDGKFLEMWLKKSGGAPGIFLCNWTPNHDFNLGANQCHDSWKLTHNGTQVPGCISTSAIGGRWCDPNNLSPPARG